MIRALIILFLGMVSLRAATTKYLDPAASGTGDGNTWANAYTTAAAAETGTPRDSIVYVADGSVGSVTFNTAVSGTQTIEWRKATAGDHGSETGWSAGMGDGQAVFTGMIFGSAYWIINGVTGGGPGSWETGHGFRLDANTIADATFGVSDGNEDNITIEHLEVDVGSTEAEDIQAVNWTYVSDWTFRNCFFHDIGGDIFKIAYGCDNLLIEYCKFKTGYQSAGVHSDVFEAQGGTLNNWIIRYNFFENVTGTYLFGAHDTATVAGYKIYGNIIWRRNNGFFFANGMISTLSAGGVITGLEFFNNTIVGDFDAGVGISVPGGSISGEARNNLWVEEADSGYAFGYGSTTQSHNSHYNMASTAGTGNENPTGDPFTDSANGDFSLVADATAGTDVSGTVTEDMFGNAFNADGDWDRGAIAFGSGAAGTDAGLTLGGATITTGGGTITP